MKKEADEAEQEGQLTDSTSASWSSFRHARDCRPDVLESATEDEVPAPAAAASKTAASQQLLQQEGLGMNIRSCPHFDDEEAKETQDPMFDWDFLDEVKVTPAPDFALLAASNSKGAVEATPDSKDAVEATPELDFASLAASDSKDAVEVKPSPPDFALLAAAAANLKDTTEKVKPTRDCALLAAGSRDIVEEAVEGIVCIAARAVSAVGGAFGGHGGGVAGAVLALGEATARTHRAPHSLENFNNLSVSMPLRPRGVTAESAKEKEAKKDKEDPKATLPPAALTSEDEAPKIQLDPKATPPPAALTSEEEATPPPAALTSEEEVPQIQLERSTPRAASRVASLRRRATSRVASELKDAIPAALSTSESEAPQSSEPSAPRAASRAASIRRRACSRGPNHAASEAAPDVDLANGSFRIAMLANGSEGDVRPLIALGKILLEEMQHQVRIFTNTNLVDICLKQGVDAVGCFANSQAVIQMCGGMRGSFMESVVKPTRVAEKWLRDHEGECKPVADALDEFKPHAIVAGAQVVAAVLRYEKLHNIPVMPVFFSRPPLELDLFNVLVNQEPPRPSFYAVSEVVDRKGVPFTRTMRTSAWALHETPTVEDLSPGGALFELKEFLDNGSPPVAIGWGSMLAVGLTPSEMLELAVRSLNQAGRRGVIIGGWAELDRVAVERLPSMGGNLATFLKEKVCFVPSAPHDWLFPQCCCIVHHGGVGTMHAVLRSCRPSVVTPICADQFEHAEVLEQRHIGIGFTKALPDVRPRELATAITAAVGNPMTLASQTVGRKFLRQEGHGAGRAAEMIDGFLRGKIKLSKLGQWVKRVPAKKVPV